MATIVLRSVKGSPLTNTEVDNNFSNINTELGQKLTGNQTITLTGDASGSGSTSIAVTLVNSGVTAGTYTKVTVDAKGRVTLGASLSSADLPTYTGTLTSSQVTTALGFTPPQPGGSGASGTWGISITGTARGVGTADPAIGTGGLWVASTTGLNVARNGTAYVVLDAANYVLYAPTLTGGGASGTWGISITGNAATVGGLSVHAGTNNEANKIVRTDGNGYANFGWINTASGDNGTTAIDRVYASSDGYIRYYTPANFRTVLDVPTRSGGSASGTWGISITGNAATVTNGIYTTNIGSYAPTLTGGGASGTWGISVTGSSGSCTGNAATASSASTSGAVYGSGFGNNNYTWRQDSGTFAGFSGWASYLISSHGDGATYYNQTIIMPFWGPPQYSRLENGTFRGPYAFLTTENYNSYAPTLTGVGASGTWGINITGNAATVTNGITTSNIGSYAPTLTGGGASGTWGISITGSAGSISGYNNPTTAATANTIVYRDASGHITGNYIFGAYFNSSAGNSENPTIGQVWTQSTGDNYLRKSTPAHFISQLGLLTTSNYNSYAMAGAGYSANQNLNTGSSPTFSEIYTNGWFRNNNSGQGLYNQATGNHFYSDGQYWNVGYAGTTGIRLRNGHAGTILGYLYAETNGNFGLLHNGGGWAVQVNPGGGGTLHGTWTIGGNTPLTSANYNSYSPTLTGGNASGTWGINISGTAAVASSTPASGISGQSGMWTSANRPGPYRLYRNDGDDPYNIQISWGADRSGYWSLRGFYNDTYHAPCYVAYSGYADSAGNAGTVGSLSIHSGRNNEANKVVRTDGSGYLQVGYINSSNGDENNASSPARVWGTNGSDSYLRSYQTSSLIAGRATRANGNFYIDDNYGYGIVGVYSSYRYQGVFAMGDSYKLPADGTTVGSLYGIAWSHPNAGGAAGNLDSHGMLVLINGGFGSSMSYSIKASGNVTAYSDERLKTNWRPMPSSFVDRLAHVRVGIYDRIDRDGLTQVGVSAQSLMNVLPWAVNKANDEMGTLSVSYGNAALASAVELARELVALRSEVEALKARLH